MSLVDTTHRERTDHTSRRRAHGGNRRRGLILTVSLAASLGAVGVASESLGLFLSFRDFLSIDDYMEHVPLWRQRFDVTGDGRFDGADVNDFLGRKGEPPGGQRFHFGFDLDGDDRMHNSDLNLVFDLFRRFPDGYDIDPASEATLPTMAAYYPWYTVDTSWDFATSVPVRGRYQSLDPRVYLHQRLEAHAAGIDIFAVSTAGIPPQVRRFHDMQAELEATEYPALTRFLWLYEILFRLPFTLNEFGQEIVNFDEVKTHDLFVSNMVELADYFHDNYLVLDGRYYPIWIWKTDTIRGDFVGAVSAARNAVLQQFGKELVIIGGELAQIPIVHDELLKRLPAFFAMSHYGIYTPRYTAMFDGELNAAHTDHTIDNLRAWIQIARQEGANNIYGQPMTYWPAVQFAFDDRLVRGDTNPVLTSTPAQREYYLQQLDREIVEPNRDIVRFVNHTSYNEHFEGHGVEPTVGYNEGRSWLRLHSVYRGPSTTYRRLIVDRPRFAVEYGAIFAQGGSPAP